jgi:hypothetical protein
MLLLRLRERHTAGDGHRGAERLAAEHGLRGGKGLVLKTIADRSECRAALQAVRREVHGSHALIEPVGLVGFSEGVEVGDAGERASRPAGSLKLRLAAAE